MALTDPKDLVINETYRIIDGHGEDEIGLCKNIRLSEFGLKWGQIATPVGEFWTRWECLEHVSIKSSGDDS